MEEDSRLKNLLSDIAYGNKFVFLVRVLLGTIFIFAGYFKVIDPESFGKVIAKYDILHGIIIPYTALIVPYLEVIIGLFMLSGYKVRASAFISIILLLLFISFISINLIKGNIFECGCIEIKILGIRLNEKIGIAVILRDILFLAAAILVFRAERHIFSIENLIDKIQMKNLSQ